MEEQIIFASHSQPELLKGFEEIGVLVRELVERHMAKREEVAEAEFSLAANV